MKIISGGQTGVDRAALDSALECGVACGGTLPKGRLTEEGPLPSRYPLQECNSEDYSVRTELNVMCSDATLILNGGELSGGTQLTAQLCQKHKKPFCMVEIDRTSSPEASQTILDFLQKTRPQVLNVAGPRESKCPGIYQKSLNILNPT
ncbi:MAG: putative molybdenum carrier protein, partial [Elusimicrobia bacterium]|nr:putative molybdenum carrier protein [Elusimicrobiota bacterium]